MISIVQWFVDGKKNFTGPRVNLDDLQNGAVVGMDPTMSADQGSSSNMYKDGPDMK